MSQLIEPKIEQLTFESGKNYKSFWNSVEDLPEKAKLSRMNSPEKLGTASSSCCALDYDLSTFPKQFQFTFNSKAQK